MAEHPVPHPDLAGYVLGVLDPGEAPAFEAHLASCGDCREEVGELRGLPALLATGAQVDVPADLRARTFARIDASKRPSSAAGRLRLQGHGLQRHIGQLTRSGPRQPGHPVSSPWDLLIAALAGGRREPGRPVLARGGRLVAAMATVVVLALAGAGAIAVLQPWRAAPGDTGEGRDIARGLTLTLIAPAGGGAQRGVARIVDTPAGRVINLRVENLPPPPPGKRYACWFVGPGDSLARPNRVAVGSFTTDSRGQAEVTLAGAAPPQRFPLLGVTLEPDDGNPARRGPKVLVTKPPR